MEESEARNRLGYATSPIEIILIKHWLAIKSLKQHYGYDYNEEIDMTEQAIKEFDELTDGKESE